jgi:Cdc6-like AAA superfamily ATPase
MSSHSDTERQKLLEFLHPLNFRDKQQDLCALRVPGSGEWFLRSPEVQKWLSGSGQTLFCTGKPGSGKTFLTALLVETMFAESGDKAEIGIAYLYFDSRHFDQKPERLLASIIQQLVYKLSPVPSGLKHLYLHHESRQTFPSLAEMSELLKSVVSGFSRVFIIMDALDELPALHRQVVVRDMLELQGHRGTNLFVTSRPIPEIASTFEGSLTLSIRAHREDLRAMIEARLAIGNRLFRMAPELREQVISSIINEADGM